MGEKPVFTCKAHVFTIDPQTKQTWLQHSQSAVDVNVFWDPNQCRHRIVSISEGKKVIIHSNITEKMNFRKTSQKFGQWADSKQSTLYGLGFSSEVELDRFVESFNKFVEEARQRSSTGSGLSRGSSSMASNGDIPTSRAQRTGSLDSGLPPAFRKDGDGSLVRPRAYSEVYVSPLLHGNAPPHAVVSGQSQPPVSMAGGTALAPGNVKYEDLGDLMNALEESQHREAELRHTLQVYTDECSRLGNKVKELENTRVDQVDSQMSARIEQLHMRDNQQGSKIKLLESENARLKARVNELESQLNNHASQQMSTVDASRVKLRELSDLLEQFHSQAGNLANTVARHSLA